MTITVHHLADSRSQRVLWLLEELGRPYEVRRYERDPKTMLAPPELRAVHPLGKSPVIEEDGRTLAESGAIVQHLIGARGPMATEAGTRARLDDLEWTHAAEASLQPLLLMALLFRLLPERSPRLARPVTKGVSRAAMRSFVAPRLAEQLGHVEDTLSEREWFAGGQGPTGADVMMIFPLEAALARAEGTERYAAIRAYVARVHARPAYERSLERGGPYAYAPKP